MWTMRDVTVSELDRLDADAIVAIHAALMAHEGDDVAGSWRGEQVWMSVRDEHRVDIYDTGTFERVASLPADKPSGIFFTSRAHRIAQ